MAIPEYPITRREQYLDAIATNDTSVLPAEPITRTEQYLDAIARNGGGGGSTGGGVLVVHDVEGTLDKTWQEIHDALSSDTIVAAFKSTESTSVEVNLLTKAYTAEEDGTTYYFIEGYENAYYVALTSSGYPTAE